MTTTTTIAAGTDRSGFIAFPMIGCAHATRWPADHGRGVSLDRATGSATLWLGRWEVHVDSVRPGAMIVAALALLAPGAMLAAALGTAR